MDHLRFKSKQTAAIYVAEGLGGAERETFELHMMDCPECVEDVETWRLMSQGIAAEQAAQNARRAPILPPKADAHASRSRPQWQLAASIVLAAALGLGGGWFMRADRGAALDDDSVGFVSMNSLTRSADCAVARLAPSMRTVAVRVPGAQPQVALVALRANGTPLGGSDYSARIQPDHSWLLRFSSTALIGQEVQLETRRDGAREPLGCISGVISP